MFNNSHGVIKFKRGHGPITSTTYGLWFLLEGITPTIVSSGASLIGMFCINFRDILIFNTLRFTYARLYPGT